MDKKDKEIPENNEEKDTSSEKSNEVVNSPKERTTEGNIQEEPKKSKNKTTKIIATILIVLIVIVGIGFLILNMNKPTTKSALTTAAKTNIKSADTTMVIKQKSSKNKTEMVTTNYSFNKDVTHLVSKLSPAVKNSTQEIWVTDKRVYNLSNGKWQYMDQSSNTKSIFTQTFEGYNSLFTAHHFDKFSNKAFAEMDIKLDGLNGYTVSYDGNNKEVIEGLQKVSTISGSNQTVAASKIKNVNLKIKLDRNKNLRELNYVVNYKNNGSSVSFNLTNINSVNNLKVPKDVKSNSTKIEIPSFN